MQDNNLNDISASIQRILEKVEHLQKENAELRQRLQQEQEKTKKWQENAHLQESQKDFRGEAEVFLQICRQAGQYFSSMGHVFSTAQKADDIKIFFQGIFEKKEVCPTEKSDAISGKEEKSDEMLAEKSDIMPTKEEKFDEKSAKGEKGDWENVFAGKLGEISEKEEKSDEMLAEKSDAMPAKEEKSQINPYDRDSFFAAGTMNGETAKNPEESEMAEKTEMHENWSEKESAESQEKETMHDKMQTPAWLLDEEHNDPFAGKEGADDDELMKNLNIKS